MKKLYFLSIFLFIPLLLFPQIRFNKLIDETAKWQSGEGIAQLSDGGFLIAASDVPEFPMGRIAFIRTDDKGSILQQTAIQDSGHHLYLYKDCLKPTPDESYFLLALDLDWAPQNIKTIFMKFKSNGDLEWYSKIGLDGKQVNTFITDMAFLPDGHFVFCGVLDSANMPNRIILGRADEQGSIIWQKIFDSPGGSGESVTHFSITPNNGYAMAVLRFAAFPNVDNVVIKLDSIGNKVWEQTLGQTFFQSAPPSIAAFPDGSLLFVGGQDSVAGITRAYAAKLAPDGAVLWANTYGLDDLNTSFFTRPIVLPDGGFVVAAGPRVDSDFKEGGQAQLVKIAPDGELVWRRRHYYHPDWIHDGRAMIPTADGGFALTGVVHNSNVHDVWLLKTDSLGCVAENCALTGSDDPATAGTASLSVYPNPVTDRLSIDSPRAPMLHLSLAATDGKLLDARSFPVQQAVHSYSWDMARLPAGIYILSVRTDKGYTQKIVAKI